MNAPRWELITEIFQAAVEEPAHRRAEFVRQACKGDPSIEGEVHKLLEADELAGSFLERPPIEIDARSKITLCDSALFSPGDLVCRRFQIRRFIGQGGMGQVYEALDTDLNTRVALKTIRPELSSDAKVLSRFKQEVQLTRRITHPNVCRTFDIDRHLTASDTRIGSEITFLSMELLEGETLAGLINRKGLLTVAEALPLVNQLVDALGAAHDAGIVHRDFKPSNVLLVSSQQGLRAVVTDFGLARAIFPEAEISPEKAVTSISGNQPLIGTLAYMAPEQIEMGEATPTTDIYALGLVMYELVTGKRPFEDRIPFVEAIKRIKQPPPIPSIYVPSLDPRWQAAILECLQTDPAARPSNVRKVSEIINSSSGLLEASQPPPAAAAEKTFVHLAPEGSREAPKRRTLFFAIIFSFLMVSCLLFVLRHYWRAENPKLPPDSIVLMTEIRNTTGDNRFDGTTELFRQQLSQSAYFTLMDNRRIREVLGQMTKPPNSPLDPPTAREIALRTGALRVIYGVVSRAGDNFILDLSIERPDSNPSHARTQRENHWSWASPSQTESSPDAIPDGFLQTIRDSSDWVRQQIGEAADDIARLNVPPQDITTNRWEALSEFVNAERANAMGNGDAAVIALRNAVRIDPHFALAYMRLGDILVSQRKYSDGYSAYTEALQQQNERRLTRRERDRILGLYALDVNDYPAAITAFRDYAAYYRGDYLGWFYQAYPFMKMGRLPEAMTVLKHAYAIDPSRLSAPNHLARFSLIAGDFLEATNWIHFLQRSGFREEAEIIDGESQFLQGDYAKAALDFEIVSKSADPQYRSWGYSFQARLAAELGRYREAIAFLNQGLNEDIATGSTSDQADKLLDRAYIEFKEGQYENCIGDTHSALQKDRDLPRLITAATILGRAAAIEKPVIKRKAVAELTDIAAKLPDENFHPVSEIVRAHVRGELLFAEGLWSKAVVEFEKADRLEAPVDDREYLARALLYSASQDSDAGIAHRKRETALEKYRISIARPGQLWEWSRNYPPGHLTDETLSYVELARRLGKFDNTTDAELQRYLQRRSHADAGLDEIDHAQQIFQQYHNSHKQ